MGKSGLLSWRSAFARCAFSVGWNGAEKGTGGMSCRMRDAEAVVAPDDPTSDVAAIRERPAVNPFNAQPMADTMADFTSAGCLNLTSRFAGWTFTSTSEGGRSMNRNTDGLDSPAEDGYASFRA